MEKEQTQSRNYWKEEEEGILKQWADKALCYQWLHARCREIYKNKNAWYTIPVIIISTVTGTANFAQDRFSEDIKEYAVITIGSLSIIAGIITTIYKFLQISEVNEGHRMAMLSWGKFHNNLKTQLAQHPLDRVESKQAIKIYGEEYERLIEMSPEILKDVIQKFNTKFKKNQELVKPDICNKLNTTGIYDITPEERDKMIDEINKDNKKKIKSFFDLDDYGGKDSLFDNNNTTNERDSPADDENQVVTAV